MKDRTSRSATAAAAICDCGNDRPYARCCGPYHDGTPAPDAEALMRSRYSAYVRELESYLLATWCARTRPANVRFEPDIRWLGLKVVRHEQTDETHAVVEFVARCRSGGASATRLCEVSRFEREDGRWYYVDGYTPASGKTGG